MTLYGDQSEFAVGWLYVAAVVEVVPHHAEALQHVAADVDALVAAHAAVFAEQVVAALLARAERDLVQPVRSVSLECLTDRHRSDPVECILETGGEILLVPNASPYERDKLATERNDFVRTHDAMVLQRDTLVHERDDIVRDRDQQIKQLHADLEAEARRRSPGR